MPTANKRQKSSTDAHQSDRSLLLQAQPDLLRKVYSFLSLKEALILRQTHRQFNEAANEIYQYSFIMNENVLKRQGIAGNDFYTSKQTKTVCNLVDNENLRAVLRNETLDTLFVYNFISTVARHSNIDNGQAVSILLEDSRCRVDVWILQSCLRKGFTAMATVLEQDARVQQMLGPCGTCKRNIGCYTCGTDNCGTDNCYESTLSYCRPCVTSHNHFCIQCNGYLCPVCFEQVYQSCEECGCVACNGDDCEFHGTCYRCARKKCNSCIIQGGENWGDTADAIFCPTCIVDVEFRDQDEYPEALERFRRGMNLHAEVARSSLFL